MPVIATTSAEQLAEILAEAASKRQTISVSGHNSKRMMGGPVLPSDIVLSTGGFSRILQYEPNDLTISVEAGMPFHQVQRMLARNDQMIALDPAHAADATVGGVVATNSSGPMRRGFGTARDQIIGMSFATLNGKIVRSGGMVVKNVAGLDTAKLIIGSFGTLAVMTSINFRVYALPRETRTFLFSFGDLESAILKRDLILRSVLQPFAIDLLNPAAAVRLGFEGYVLAARAGGSSAVLDRYARELETAEQLTGGDDAAFWQNVRDFSTDFLARCPGGIVLRVSTALSGLTALLACISEACISRAGSGVSYVHLPSWAALPSMRKLANQHRWHSVVEYASDDIRSSQESLFSAGWDPDSSAFGMMKRVKQVFDPSALLNRSRLYGRI